MSVRARGRRGALAFKTLLEIPILADSRYDTIDGPGQAVSYGIVRKLCARKRESMEAAIAWQQFPAFTEANGRTRSHLRPSSRSMRTAAPVCELIASYPAASYDTFRFA